MVRVVGTTNLEKALEGIEYARVDEWFSSPHDIDRQEFSIVISESWHMMLFLPIPQLIKNYCVVRRIK